MLCKALDK